MPQDIAIYIVTYNHNSALRRMLPHLVDSIQHHGRPIELWIADNADLEETRDIAQSVVHPLIEVHYRGIPTKGKSRAFNAVLHHSDSEFVLCLDDDVHVAKDWLAESIIPLEEGILDFSTGLVNIADHLQRPWYTDRHETFFADTRAFIRAQDPQLIGANVGFHRKVFTRVKSYDPELGPGALGFAEDTLLGHQLRGAGYRFGYNQSSCCTHHFRSDRISLKSFFERAFHQGRSEAYFNYHWYHSEPSVSESQLAVDSLREQCESAQSTAPMEEYPVTENDLNLMYQYGLHKHFLELAKCTTRNYAKLGLEKVAGELPVFNC